MLSINDLSEAVQAYKEGSASLNEFADWFHRASRGSWGESKEVQGLCSAIHSAFDALDYDGLGEQDFRKELDQAIRPFVVNVKVTVGELPSKKEPTTTTSSHNERERVGWNGTQGMRNRQALGGISISPPLVVVAR